MASRQVAPGGSPRNKESDLRGMNRSISAVPYRPHHSNADPEETSKRCFSVRMTRAAPTLVDGNTLESPQVDANLQVGATSMHYEEGEVELDEMDIDAVPSIDANDAFDEASETLMKDEAELLLSLRKKQTSASELVVACTFKNIRYIYLTQPSIHKLMNLETTMKNYGWDLSVAGVELMKGVTVLVGHENGWKLRRIDTCKSIRSVHRWLCLGNRKTTELHLEDGTIVTPLQIYDRSLEKNNAIQEFVLGELNYQIEKSKLNPIGFHQNIQRGHDLHQTLQELAQGLMNSPLMSFLEDFKKFVDPMSATECRRSAKMHAEKMRFVGDQLPSIWRSWLGLTKDDGSTLEDALIFNAKMMPLEISPPKFLHSAAVATDPRRSSGLHVIRTNDTATPIRAPRRPIPSREKNGDGRSNDRVRTRSVNNIHRDCMIRSELQCDIAYESWTDAERALRRVRRNYENDGNGFEV